MLLFNETIIMGILNVTAIQMVIDGADIIDVGGESTRPGADDITSDEELRRAAIEAGADIVNDVSGGTYDPDMFSTVAALGVPIILMHMRGNPKTMQSHVNYDDVGGVVDGVAKELLCRSVNAEGVYRVGSKSLIQGLALPKT